jgi:glycosyltransferase involved in cell wall biosynthesis
VSASPLRVAHVSTFLPTPCGIAHYSQFLIDHLVDVESSMFRLSYSWDSPAGSRSFAAVAPINDLASFSRLAELVNNSPCDVVDLQHEFGIWGGTEGEGVLLFLQECQKPIVTTFHTTSTLGRNHRQTEMLRRLVHQSRRVVTLTEASRDTLDVIVPASSTRTIVIRHGTPDVRFAPRNLRSEPVRFVSPGFFRPDKGIETVLAACGALKDAGVAFSYRIVGEAQTQAVGQVAYAERIQRLVADLGLNDRVDVRIGRYSTAAFLREIQECDCGVIGYTDMAQNSTGVIPWILACGRPVVSTPFQYAVEMAKYARGMFVAERPDAVSVARQMRLVAERREGIRTELMEEVHASARQWAWRQAARGYREAFAAAAERHAPLGTA